MRLIFLLAATFPASSAVRSVDETTTSGSTEAELKSWCEPRGLLRTAACMAELRRWCTWSSKRLTKPLCRLFVDAPDIDIAGSTEVDFPAKNGTEGLPSNSTSAEEERPQGISQERLRELQLGLAAKLRFQGGFRQLEDAKSDVDGEFAWPPEEAKEQHTEAQVNRELNLWEGDVVLSEAQADALERHLLRDHRRRKRKISKLPYYLWANLPIAYSFQAAFPEYARAVVNDTLRLFEAETCVRFVEDGSAKHRLEFRSGIGCSSFVGQMGGVQAVSIQTPGCEVVGIVAHEVGHALGLFHEQGRPDQNSNIAIDFANIHALHWANFLPQRVDLIDYALQPYDLGSVMHYGPYGFALDIDRPAIRTKDSRYQATIGQRREPSFVDFAQINRAYCSEMCPPRRCHYGGYPDPNNCTVCKCPLGLGGADCSGVQSAECGGTLEAFEEPQLIASPGYPRAMPQSTACAWLIKAGNPAANVSVQFFGDFHFACKTVCDDHFVEIKRGPDFRSTGPRFCCFRPPALPMVSNGGSLLVVLRRHPREAFPSRGFQLRYWSPGSGPKPKFTKETFTFAPATTSGPTTEPPTTEPKIDYFTTESPTSTWTTSPTSSSVSGTPSSSTEPSAASTSSSSPSSTSTPLVITSSTSSAPSSTSSSFTTTSTTATTFPSTTTATTTPSTTQPISTTTTTITPAPTTTSGPSNSNADLVPSAKQSKDACDSCSRWTAWGACSQSCGGCGGRNRQRSCTSTKCAEEEKRRCGFIPCASGPFLLGGGEFHILWDGCCVGLVRTQGNVCGRLQGLFPDFANVLSSLGR